MTSLLLAAATESTGTLQSAIDFLKKGGLFMIPLAFTSVAGLMAILYKFLSLARSRVIPPLMATQLESFENLISTDRIEPLLQSFERGESTLARLATVAVKHRGRTQAEITQAIEASAREESARLHAGIGVLDVVITVAPLLGLLGTASGLVAIFKGLGATTDHLAIALGIAEALSTTIVGLAIAIPCVIAHSYFTRRIEMLTARLESLLADLAYVCAKAKPQA